MQCQSPAGSFAWRRAASGHVFNKSLLSFSTNCPPQLHILPHAEFQEFNENEDEELGYFAAYAKLKK